MVSTCHRWTNLGLKLAYHEWHEPQAAPRAPETLVLLHGFLDHGRSFAPIAEVLARRFRVIAPDHRGHGESGWIGAGGYYHFPDYVLDLVRLFDHLGLERAHVAGHSMGASIACYFAGAFGERVSSLALLDGVGPSHVPVERGPALMRRWVNDVRLAEARGRSRNATPDAEADGNDMASLDEVARRLARTSPGATHERLMTLAETAAARGDDGRYRWRFDPLHRTTGPMPFDAARFRAFLQAIRCPTLAVWGERSPMRPSDAKERLSLVAEAREAILPGAAHNLHHERPEELAALLSGFFA